jgi:hypothetical protein
LVADPSKRLVLDELKIHPWLVEGAAYPDAPGSKEVLDGSALSGSSGRVDIYECARTCHFISIVYINIGKMILRIRCRHRQF